MSIMSTGITGARPLPLMSPSDPSMCHRFPSMCKSSHLRSLSMPRIAPIQTPTCTSSPPSPQTLTSTMPMCHACLSWPAEGSTALMQIRPPEAGCLPWVPTSTSGVMQNHSKGLILRGESTSLELSLSDMKCNAYLSIECIFRISFSTDTVSKYVYPASRRLVRALHSTTITEQRVLISSTWMKYWHGSCQWFFFLCFFPW